MHVSESVAHGGEDHEHICQHSKVLEKHYESLEIPKRVDRSKIPKEMTIEHEN